jgi:hypothetical protein
MTDPHRDPDPDSAAEEPGTLSEYGNDTGFARDALDPEPAPTVDRERPDEESPLDP